MTLVAKKGRCPHCGHTNEPFVSFAAPQPPAAPVLRRLTDEEVNFAGTVWPNASFAEAVRWAESTLAAKNGARIE